MASTMLLRVLLCGLLASVLTTTVTEARRPGGRLARRNIMPQPGEVQPELPAGLVFVPPPERSSVDVSPPISMEDVMLPSAAEPAQTCSTYTEIDIRPLRQQWNSGNGYCGEMSLQMSALARGIYISQKTARQLGVAAGANHPDLLFDERIQPASQMSGIYGVAKMLGLAQPPESYWYSDNMTLTNGMLTPQPSSFALWIKRNVMAGRPVIGGFRIRGGSYPDYDHIMPVYGVCYSSGNSLATSDVFTLTDDYLGVLRRSPADSSFYARFRQCAYTGCIPSDYYDYGVAVGPIAAPSGLYFPIKLNITDWSDGSRVEMEPGEYSATTATAGYRLRIRGLTTGQTYRLYRTNGLFSGFRVPQSAIELKTVCASQGTACKSLFFTATATSMTATHNVMGRFRATGVTYFFCVRSSS